MQNKSFLNKTQRLKEKQEVFENILRELSGSIIFILNSEYDFPVDVLALDHSSLYRLFKVVRAFL